MPLSEQRLHALLLNSSNYYILHSKPAVFELTFLLMWVQKLGEGGVIAVHVILI